MISVPLAHLSSYCIWHDALLRYSWIAPLIEISLLLPLLVCLNIFHGVRFAETPCVIVKESVLSSQGKIMLGHAGTRGSSGAIFRVARLVDECSRGFGKCTTPYIAKV